MPIMELVVRGTYQGQETVNRWNYLSGGTPATVSLSFALAYAFGLIPTLGVVNPLSVFGRIIGLVNPQALFVESQVRDVYSVTDFYSVPYSPNLSGQNLLSGTATAPFNAFGFRTNRTRLDIRRATKRFAGVGEADVENGGTFSANVTGFLPLVAAAMSDVIEYDDEGNTITFSPIVVSKEKYVTPEGNDAYRYYPTEAAQLAEIATGIVWSEYSTVRSQVSRQYGRGQ